MKLSKRQQEIEARRASDPLSQIMERDDVDYTNPDELPTAPRTNYRGTPSQLSPNPDPNAPMDEPDEKHCPTCTCAEHQAEVGRFVELMGEIARS